ncbi:MAG: hypothetical protein AAGA57_01900 [Planctomycetota bacterium]
MHKPAPRTHVALLTTACALLGADVALRATAPGPRPQAAHAADESKPFNAAGQRRAMISELQEIRAEVAGIRADLKGGNITVKVEGLEED